MTKKAFKSQASSSRAVSGAFGGVSNDAGLGSRTTGLGGIASSPLSHVYEPPDLRGLSDPNVVVAFKNLQKKDGTTKSKALEDLQLYIQSLNGKQYGLEEAMLEAWSKVYPRTSIDNSRRVRQLAHNLQGQIATLCGKRFARCMPQLVGAWLAGVYDNDKAVSRAAQDSLKHVFPSEEKFKTVWLVYQVDILRSAQDIIEKETTNTLSDERTTSPDDALSKYTRTLGAAVMTITNLIETIPQTDLAKSQAQLEHIIRGAQIWKLASSSDAFVRRAIYRLLVVTLAKRKEDLDPAVISANMLTSALHISQDGSAYDYVKAIALVSAELPPVWTRNYQGTGKKSARNRLCHFLRTGSQGGPPEYWGCINDLIEHLPTDILVGELGEKIDNQPSDELPSYVKVLNALHDGVVNKNEPRTNSNAAWNIYLSASEITARSLPNSDQRTRLLASFVQPILLQYIRPSPEYSRWTIAGPQPQTVCIKACLQVLNRDEPFFVEHWRGLSAQIVEDIKTSLPEQSKDYVRSQESLRAETSRWHNLRAVLLEEVKSSSLHNVLSDTLESELESAISTLKARNGKPYGAAATVETAMQLMPKLILKMRATKTRLCTFVNNDSRDLIFSPSAKYLIHTMELLQPACDVTQGFDQCTQALAEATESAQKKAALQAFLSSRSIANNGSLASMAKLTLEQALRKDDPNDWDIVVAVASNAHAHKDLTDDLLATMTESLSIDAQRLPSIHGLELLGKRNTQLMSEYSSTPEGSPLLARLLYLADGPDDTVTHRAQGLSILLQDAMLAGPDGNQISGSVVNLIKRSLCEANVESLSIESLVKQAVQAFTQSPEADKFALVAEILPRREQWARALEPFVSTPPNPSIAITTSFGGAMTLIENAHKIEVNVSYDDTGQSLLLRVMRYVIDLFNTTNMFGVLSTEQRLVLAKNLAVTVQLAGDNLSVQGSMPLWVSSETGIASDVGDFIAQAQSHLASWLFAAPESVLTESVMSQLLEESLGSSSTAYYSGRAFSAIATELSQLHGPSGDEDAIRLKSALKSPDTFAAAALLFSASGGPASLRSCNELLADLTVFKFHAEQKKCLRSLIFLNCIFESSEGLVDEVPQQRLVFFVKHIVEELSQASSPAQAEIIRALHAVLPLLKDVYGSFWGLLFDFMNLALSGSTEDENLPLLSASLRLLSILRKPDMQEGNDDLLDVWTDQKCSLAKTLIGLISKLKDHPDESHQPRRIVNEILSRQLVGFGTYITEDVEDLYPVIASEPEALQIAAYEILHAIIPTKQEQVSLEKALEKDFEAKLPEELLSLILAPPPMDVLAEADFGRNMPSSLRSYLLSWKLTFDHWTGASYTLQADYTKNLTDGPYLPNLLDLIFQITVTSRYKPIDASKFAAETYGPGVETPEKDTHWLLIHLYYTILLRVPTPAKIWWRDTTNRQTNLAVQTWTEKYISPIIIATELSAIKDWAPSQVTADDNPLTVKVSHTTHEITASIPIDEQTTSISIRLPPSYPLSRAEVAGTHRVGVPENKWNSWIRNAQGQITTSEGGSNAVIDCLLAWKRNVTAAMKGQTECAICYSVVGADKTLPKKKCPTCKNCFHAGCLFRWFKSSNSSSCPLCRNTFQY